MASSPKVEYKNVNNYIVKFGHSGITYLILCYNVNREFHNLSFKDVEEAEKWLYAIAEVLEKNVMETTYVP